MLPWRHPPRFPQMAICWVRRGDIWVLKLVRVRDQPVDLPLESS